jgi:hypothetical protein
MSAAALEAFLARLYTDEPLRRAFLDRPEPVARAAGLDEAAVAQVAQMDLEGLVLAADSFARKRAAHSQSGSRPGSRTGARTSWPARWRAWLPWRRR